MGLIVQRPDSGHKFFWVCREQEAQHERQAERETERVGEIAYTGG